MKLMGLVLTIGCGIGYLYYLWHITDKTVAATIAFAVMFVLTVRK